MCELLKPLLSEGIPSHHLRQMLSLNILSPNISTLIIQQPISLLTQPSQRPKQKLFSTIRQSHNYNPDIYNCIRTKYSYRLFELQDSSLLSNPREIPDGDLSNEPSESKHFIDSGVLASWLQSCKHVKDVQKVHSLVWKCLGLSNIHVNNNLISVYSRIDGLSEARKVFDEMSERNVVTWTAMVNGYGRCGLDDEALRLFHDAVRNGIQGNCKTYVCVLNSCSKVLDFELGRQVHACVVKLDQGNVIVDSAVVHFYVQCGCLDDAFRVFDEMEMQDVVSWTTIITACAQQRSAKVAFSLFSEMLCSGLLPNEYTVCSVLTACGEEKALKFGRQLHGAMVKKLIKHDVFVGTSLVDMYAKCGEVLAARKVFDCMERRNTVTWTSIILGYARKGLGEDAINLFREMKRKKVNANNLTILSILLACGSMKNLLLGKEMHAQIVKNTIQANIYIASTLVWFYCRCGKDMMALNVLEQMPFRDVVSWTAMISGCAHLGLGAEALELLKDMMEEGVEPNSHTYSSVLKACAKLEAIVQGKLIHSTVNKTSAVSNVFVGSALIHMYSKCGYISEAIQVFDSMPEKNLVTWQAMIIGYARNGLCQQALKLMYRMREEGIKVDDYVLATVLTACGDIKWEMEPLSGYCLQLT